MICDLPFKLESEFCRPSPGKSSPNTFCSFLWNPLLKLDFDPVLLTVLALATEGLRSSLGNPIASSLELPPVGAKPGERWPTSSLSESLKKLLQTLFAMFVPPLEADDAHGGLEFALEAVGGLREIDGILPPEVCSTARSFR